MTNDPFRFADAYGPAKTLYIHNAAAGLKAIVVVDNCAAGPAIGGTRMAPDVSLEECFRLARAMTFKNAAASLPHGGAKSVIFADPAMPDAEKESLVRAFADAIRDVTDYIPGPDMGTNERAMAWIYDETGRSVGLPREIGGIPLDEIGATGWGVAVAADVAQEFAGFELAGARIVVQGFGAVGYHAARFLGQRGAVLVGASDSRGAITAPDGLDVAALAAHKASGQSVATFAGGQSLDADELVATPCEIWIPAARPDVVTRDNAERLDCRLFLQGANIPATPEAEHIMHERGILSVPDFIANAGGVICASVEYHGGGQAAAFTAIEEKVRDNTRAVLISARDGALEPRAAANQLAGERVKHAMSLRRWRN